MESKTTIPPFVFVIWLSWMLYCAGGMAFGYYQNALWSWM